MKIGLTGSQGTGKTSVAREFSKRFSDWHVVGSMARDARVAGLKINREADPLSQLLTTVARINAESDLEGNVLSERTVLDHVAYTSYQKTHVWTDPAGHLVWLESLRLAKYHMATYDIVAYFPVYWSPKIDRDRDGDTEYQRSVDWYLRNLLDTLGIHYVTMKNESVNKRVEFLAHLIKE